jgi:hypothetical protein
MPPLSIIMDRDSAIFANNRCGSSPKNRHDCQGFFKSLKADPIDQKTLASFAAVRRIQQFQTQNMDALSSFKLNAMMSVSAMMMPGARTGSVTRTNAFLPGRQSSKWSIETLLLLKGIRMRHKCEALWHYCNSSLEVHLLKTSRTVRAASALDQREDRMAKVQENSRSPVRNIETSETLQHVSCNMVRSPVSAQT